MSGPARWAPDGCRALMEACAAVALAPAG